MKWANHIVLTGAIAFAISGDALNGLFAMAGSVLPDKLEGPPPRQKKAYWQWRKKHRTFTHWTAPYLLGIFVLLVLAHQNLVPPEFMLPFRVLLFGLFGALCHILEDGVCGRVPLIWPHRKIGLRLFSVGSPGEYFFVGGILALLLGTEFSPAFAGEFSA